MITPGRIAAGFFGTAAGLFLGRALFKWILDLHGAWAREAPAMPGPLISRSLLSARYGRSVPLESSFVYV